MEFRLNEVVGISPEEVNINIQIDGETIELGIVYSHLKSDSQVKVTVFHNSENVGWYQTQLNKLQRQIRVNLVDKFTSPTPYVVIGISTTLEIITENSPVKQFSLASFENLDPKPHFVVPKLAIPLLQLKNTPRNSKLEKVLQELTKEYSTLKAKYDNTTQLQAAQILDLQHQLRDTMTQHELDKLNHENILAAVEDSHKSQLESDELKLHALNLVIEDQKHLLNSRDKEIVGHKNTIKVYREFIQKLLMLFTSQLQTSKQRETKVLSDFNDLDKENLSINRTVSHLSLKNNSAMSTNTTLEQEKYIEKSYNLSLDEQYKLVNFLENLDLTAQIDLESTFTTISSVYQDIFSTYSSQASKYFSSQLEVLKQSSLHLEDIIHLDNLTTRLNQDSAISDRIKSHNKDLKDYISTLLSTIETEKRKSRALNKQTSMLSEDIAHYRSLLTQLESSSSTLKQAKQDLHSQMYDTLLKSGPIGPELIDKLLTAYLAANDQPNLFVKNSDGAYIYGNKKVGVLVRNGSLVVRVGGGYMCIDEFIRVYDTNKSQEESFDKSFQSPNYKNISIVRRSKKQNEEESLDKSLVLSPVPCDLTYDASNAINGLRKKDVGSNLPRLSFTPKKSGVPRISLSFTNI